MEEQVKGSDDVQLLLARFSRWEREGTLDNLERLLKAVNALMDILTPEIVESSVRMIATSLEFADALTHSEVLPVVPILRDVEGVLRNPPPRQKHEFRHLWREINDPDVQNGLELAMGLLKLVGQRTVVHAAGNGREAENQSGSFATT